MFSLAYKHNTKNHNYIKQVNNNCTPFMVFCVNADDGDNDLLRCGTCGEEFKSLKRFKHHKKFHVVSKCLTAISIMF